MWANWGQGYAAGHSSLESLFCDVQLFPRVRFFFLMIGNLMGDNTDTKWKL